MNQMVFIEGNRRHEEPPVVFDAQTWHSLMEICRLQGQHLAGDGFVEAADARLMARILKQHGPKSVNRLLTLLEGGAVRIFRRTQT